MLTMSWTERFTTSELKQFSSLTVISFIYLFSARDIINLATGKDCVHHFTGIVEPTIDQVPTCSWSL